MNKMNLTSVSLRNLKLLLTKYIQRTKHRRYSTKRSNDIRQDFLDFFMKEHNHTYVRSSPVVPFCDPTIPFVNAGMNQFRGVFLGQFSPPDKRAVNYQKCVRVGGNHNDLDIVGSDGTHHTFFEMLGNWSFDDYYKKEACQMAWELLTGPYGFRKNDLIISYFGGDSNLGLEADYECRDIWSEIGIAKDHIVKKGIADNFWVMGETGPCGPCTEIYFRDPNGNLVEIWNIVFIQFDRQKDGSIIPLSKCYIDTGMGLERLTALLQNKNSNYDTDLFEPIIETIYKQSKSAPKYSGAFGNNAAIDNAYRTLADHARMISICLADGAYPCRNLRLRNVLRKAISISKDVFKCPPETLTSLYDKVADILGPVYPELYDKAGHCKKIILHEEQMLLHLEKKILGDRKTLLEKYPETSQLPYNLLPGLAEGYKQFKMEMENMKDGMISGKMAFKLYDAFGIDEKMIKIIADINQLSVDENSFKEYLSEHKSRHKAVILKTANVNINRVLNDNIDVLIERGVPFTQDNHKYDYTIKSNNRYEFPKLEAKILSIITETGEIVESISSEEGSLCHVVFDKSNFYCEEGGQCGDIGKVKVSDENILEIERVSKIRNIIVHSGKFNKLSDKKSLRVGDSVSLELDEAHRYATMQNHTSTHLLNFAIKKVLPESVTCQLSSKVTPSGLMLDLAVYGDKLSTQTIKKAQDLVRNISKMKCPIHVSVIDSQQLLKIENVVTVPGEIYPESGLRMIEIDIPGIGVSRELCCGTHVNSSDHLEDFSVIAVRGAGGHSPTIRAVSGKLALNINNYKQTVENMYKELEMTEVADQDETNEKIKRIRDELQNMYKGDGAPFGTVLECIEMLGVIEKKLKDMNAKILIELLKEEMSTVISDASKKNFITHFLVCSYLLEPSSLSLTIAAQCAIDKPILLMGCANGIIKATCQVPQLYLNENFNAEKWMSSIIPVFDTHIMPPSKKQNVQLIAHMKGKKVSLINCESLVADAIKEANKYAKIHCPQMVNDDQIHKWSDGKMDKQRGQN